MTPKLTGLMRSREKGAWEALDSCLVTAAGIPGDRNAEDKGRPLSLLSVSARAAMQNLGGLCTARFHANLITEGLDYAALQAGVRLRLGECLLEITQAGKACYAECPLREQGGCPLPHGCAFARVVRGGRIRAGDTIERTNDGA